MTDFTFIKHLFKKIWLVEWSWDINIFLGYGKYNAHTFVNEWDKPKGKVLFLFKLKKSFNYSMHNDLLL